MPVRTRHHILNTGPPSDTATHTHTRARTPACQSAPAHAHTHAPATQTAYVPDCAVLIMVMSSGRLNDGQNSFDAWYSPAHSPENASCGAHGLRTLLRAPVSALASLSRRVRRNEMPFSCQRSRQSLAARGVTKNTALLLSALLPASRGACGVTKEVCRAQPPHTATAHSCRTQLPLRLTSSRALLPASHPGQMPGHWTSLGACC